MLVRPFRLLGRQVVGDPAAAAGAPERVDVVAVGDGGQPLHFVLTDAGCRVDEAGRPPVPLVGQPAVTSWGDGRLDAFLRDDIDRLHYAYIEGGQWRRWLPVGPLASRVGAEPAVAHCGKGVMVVFTRTVKGELEHYWYNDGIGLMGPETLGGPIAGRPAVVTASLFGVHVLVRGGDDGLLRRKNTRPLQRSHDWAPSTWQPSRNGFDVCPPASADGAALYCTADPAVLKCRGSGRVENRLLAYARQHDRLLQLEPSGWAGASRDRLLAENEVASDPACASPYPCRVDVFTAVAGGSVGQLTVELGESGMSTTRWRVLDDGRVAAVGRPTVVSSKPGRLDLIFRSVGGQLCHGWWDAATDVWNADDG